MKLRISLLIAVGFAFGAAATRSQELGSVELPRAKVGPVAKSEPPADPIDRIKDEGLNRSQVLSTLTYLTEVIGPRLTPSPNLRRANEWTRDKLEGWGLRNAHLEAWSPPLALPGWTLERCSVQLVEPQCIPLVAYPKAWSPGTKGRLVGGVVWVDVADGEARERLRGKLRGAVVLFGPIRPIETHFEPEATRKSEAQLIDLARPPQPEGRQSPAKPSSTAPPPGTPPRISNGDMFRFFIDEGVALVIEPSPRGEGGTLFVQSISGPSGRPDRAGPPDSQSIIAEVVPQVVVAAEQYNRMARMLRLGERLKIDVELAVKFDDGDKTPHHTVAEIPGTDLKDQLVMLGAHLDSWGSGTGATDNGAGVAVCMEAVRILQALKLQPRRTVRIALWSGEEMGAAGSREYVGRHFGRVAKNPESGAPKQQGPWMTFGPEYEKLSCYYNLDHGHGKIRGIYLNGNEELRPIFRDWLVPFRDMGASTLAVSDVGIGGSDHYSFNAVGLPGLQFVQDDLDYWNRTHHTNQDVLDRIRPDDLKQAAVVLAAFVHNSAMRDERLPRRPMTAP